MEAVKSVIHKAIEEKTTLMVEHLCREVCKEPLKVEVFPYKVDGDYLICYDLDDDQPYIINLNNLIKIDPTEKKFLTVPKECWLK